MSIENILEKYVNETQPIIEIFKKASIHGSFTQHESQLLVEYSFFEIYKKYESFIEHSFVSYMMGQESIQGGRATSCLVPTDDEHALKLLSLNGGVLSWTVAAVVNDRASNVLSNANPFADPIKSNLMHLEEMRTIRNAIAHSSANTQKNFDKLVRSVLSPADVGICPADFLLKSLDYDSPVLFEVYCEKITLITAAVANYTS